MNTSISRRKVLTAAVAATAGASLSHQIATAQTTRPDNEPFGYCLNTSTISGANLGIVEEVKVASDAGYSAIEPWMRTLEAYLSKGGSTADLRKRIADAGLVVADVIGFSPWVIDDDAARAKGLEQMKREMGLVAEIGGKHMAAPPAGVPQDGHVDPYKAAERYRVILELGETMGVSPLLELWGFAKVLNRLGEVSMIAIESGRADASMLLDLYHLYKGGSGFTGLNQINGQSLHVIHVNDYPASPPREQISDAFRVFPGDGIAPLDQIFRDLRDNGFRGYLSLELFNRDYWKQSPLKVAKLGLEKTRAAVRKALM